MVQGSRRYDSRTGRIAFGLDRDMPCTEAMRAGLQQAPILVPVTAWCPAQLPFHCTALRILFLLKLYTKAGSNDNNKYAKPNPISKSHTPVYL